MDGIQVEALLEAGEIIQRLSDRILGRITQEEHPRSGYREVIIPIGTEIDEARVLAIDEAGIERVSIARPHLARASRRVRHVLRPRSGQGKLVEIGEAIGIIAGSPSASPEPSSPCVLPHRRHGEQDIDGLRSATATRARSSSSHHHGAQPRPATSSP